MARFSRREFLGSLTMGSIASASSSVAADTAAPPAGFTAVPMLHVTDLFRPHIDPDDHWDLACVYALAQRGNADLRGVLIDYPPATRKTDPDLFAVSQLNYLTGLRVPVMVGSEHPMQSRNDRQLGSKDDRGVRSVLAALRESHHPIVISVLGSCSDVAAAGKREPTLFAEKCAAVYLNAGIGTRDKVKGLRREYNVGLNPAAYAAMFDLPCPVYWMPCFEELAEKGQSWRTMEWGTYYRFRQSEILPHLPSRLKNYFAYVYKHGWTPPNGQPPGCDWLRYLLGPNDEKILTQQAERFRNMWCTAGFLHAAGLTVSREGKIIPLAGASDAVFTFVPVRVRCSDEGTTEWEKDETSKNRFIFRVCDCQKYEAAMTAAMKSLLMTLGD